jgi:hypothetical protein
MCSVNVEISYVVSNFMMERCGENFTISFLWVFLLERIERVWPLFGALFGLSSVRIPSSQRNDRVPIGFLGYSPLLQKNTVP